TSGRLQHRDRPLGSDLECLLDPVVALQPAGDVQGIDRYIGPQRLQDRVAPGDDLAARLVATRGPAGPRAASPVGSRRGAGLRLLVGLVVRPVDSLRGGSLAL